MWKTQPPRCYTSQKCLVLMGLKIRQSSKNTHHHIAIVKLNHFQIVCKRNEKSFASCRNKDGSCSHGQLNSKSASLEIAEKLYFFSVFIEV